MHIEKKKTLKLTVIITIRSFRHAWPITGFVTRATRLVPREEQELLALPSSLPVLVGSVLLDLYFFVCNCFVDRCLSFFFWPMCCLSFDLRLLITTYGSSNFSDMNVGKGFLKVKIEPTRTWRQVQVIRRTIKGFIYLGEIWLVFGKYREVKTCLQSFKINVCSCFHSLWWCVHN